MNARTQITGAAAIERLHRAAARVERTLRFMEVCGTHTVNAFRAGLHDLLPANVKLISGPGCPVCVTSQGDIDQLIQLASRPNLTLCTYGDMMRVTGSSGSLEDARSNGADVRVVYSAMDAVKLAQANGEREVCFAAVGFETTAPSTAVAVRAARSLSVKNFTVLASHKLVMPALHALLQSGRVAVDGFVCPGHVAIVIGSEAFLPVVEQYGLPCVVTGFEGEQIAAALARLVETVVERRTGLQPVVRQRDGSVDSRRRTRTGSPCHSAVENLYPQAVTREGNRVAQQILHDTFEPADVYWRGLGMLPQSGLKLRDAYAAFDANVRFDLKPIETREPPGCRCGDVICGQVTPAECKLFGTLCTPVRPIGPCMVSSEGTCQAWFKYRRRHTAGEGASVAAAPLAPSRVIVGGVA